MVGEKTTFEKIEIDTTYLIIGAMLLLGVCCTFLPLQIVAILMLGFTFLLCIKKNGVLALPVLLYYYNYFGDIAGIRTFYVCAILIVAFDIKSILKIKRDITLWLAVLVYFLYLVCVVSSIDIKAMIYSGIAIVSVLYAKKKLSTDEKTMRLFFCVFAMTAIVSYFTGLMNQNVYDSVLTLDGQVSNVIRGMGTFNDPNYMGVFYSVAVFAIVTLELFDKRLRVIIICTLYVMIATTLSMTAILGNAFFWIIYLLLTKKINLKTVIIIMIVAVVCSIIYQYGLSHRDIPYLGDLSARISDKLQNINNINSLTTGRTGHAEDHWNYYWSQNGIRMLIGGNCVNSLAIDPKIDTIAAHNEYVDLLLNVGVAGTAILILYLIKRMIQEYFNYRNNGCNRYALCVFIIKVIYAFYAATLTLFMENRFLLFYFL